MIAAWALWYAYRKWGTARIHVDLTHQQTLAAQEQVAAARSQAEAAKETVRQASVRTLLDVHRDFNTSLVMEARTEFQALRRTVENRAEQEMPAHLTAEQKLEFKKDLYSGHLYDLRKDDLQKYLTILRLPSYFETVGMLVERDDLDFEDVFNLFSGAIVRVDEVVGTHIQKRQEEEGMPPGYLENYRSLAKRAKERLS